MARPIPIPSRESEPDSGFWLLEPELSVSSTATPVGGHKKARKARRIGFLDAKSRPRNRKKGKR